MKKLLLVVPLAVAACSSDRAAKLDGLVPNLYIASPQGAGLGGYSLAEYHARVADGQPGLTRRQEPWTAAEARRPSSGSLRKTRRASASTAPAVSTGAVQTGPKTAAEARAIATATPTTYRMADGSLVTVVLLPDGAVKETIQFGTPPA